MYVWEKGIPCIVYLYSVVYFVLLAAAVIRKTSLAQSQGLQSGQCFHAYQTSIRLLQSETV